MDPIFRDIDDDDLYDGIACLAVLLVVLVRALWYGITGQVEDLQVQEQRDRVLELGSQRYALIESHNKEVVKLKKGIVAVKMKKRIVRRHAMIKTEDETAEGSHNDYTRADDSLQPALAARGDHKHREISEVVLNDAAQHQSDSEGKTSRYICPMCDRSFPPGHVLHEDTWADIDKPAAKLASSALNDSITSYQLAAPPFLQDMKTGRKHIQRETSEHEDRSPYKKTHRVV